MPHVWRGGMLNFAILLANILSEMREAGAKVIASLAVPDAYDDSAIVGLNPGVNVVKFKVTPVQADDFRFKGLFSAHDRRSGPSTYSCPEATDGSMDLALSDIWITLTGLFGEGPLLPIKPYIVYAPDFIQRVVPQIYDGNPEHYNWIVNTWQSLTVQQSNSVIVTTPQTGADAVSYAGAQPAKVHLLPMVNAPLFGGADGASLGDKAKKDRIVRFLTSPDPWAGEAEGDGRREPGPDGEPYFLWVTNSTAHKNHRRAVDALEIYYERYGGRLSCVMCGAQTEMFKKGGALSLDHLDYFRRRMASTHEFGGRVKIAGELSHEEYRRTLTNAAFLWHNVIYDNGTFSVIEAARLGTRSLVAGYPQMKYICDQFKINAKYFDAWSAEDAASKLKEMERSLVSEGVAGICSAQDNTRKDFALKIGELLRQAIAEGRGGSSGVSRGI